MRIALDAQLAKTTGQRIDQQQTADQRLAESGQQLERLQRLQAADHAHQRTDHARLAAGQLGLAAMPVQAVIAGAGFQPRIEHGELSLETNRRTADQRLSGLHAGCIDRLADGEIVRAVEHQIDLGNHCIQRVGIQPAAIRNQAHMRVQCFQPGHGGVDLVQAKRWCVVNDLTLQVGQVQRVEVGQMQFANPCSREIQRYRRAEPTETDNQRPALLEP